MDYLREGIHLRGIGQKDPVSEWQREGFDMFSSMLESVYRDFVKYAMHAEVVTAEGQNNRPERVNYSSSETPAELAPAAAPPKPSPAAPTVKQTQVVKTEDEKIGRNDPCHCGSGKKFKHCHGR
jgi:preprotein translocase subunit SecA